MILTTESSLFRFQEQLIIVSIRWLKIKNRPTIKPRSIRIVISSNSTLTVLAVYKTKSMNSLDQFSKVNSKNSNNSSTITHPHFKNSRQTSSVT